MSTAARRRSHHIRPLCNPFLYLIDKYALTLLDSPQLRKSPIYRKQFVKTDVGPIYVVNNLQYLVVRELRYVSLHPGNEAWNYFIFACYADFPMTKNYGHVVNLEFLDARNGVCLRFWGVFHLGPWCEGTERERNMVHDHRDYRL